MKQLDIGKMTNDQKLIGILVIVLIFSFIFFMVFYGDNANGKNGVEGQQIERDDDKKLTALQESDKKEGSEKYKREMENKNLNEAVSKGYEINTYTGDTIWDDENKTSITGVEKMNEDQTDTISDTKTEVVKEKVIVHYVERPAKVKKDDLNSINDDLREEDNKGRMRGGFAGSKASAPATAVVPGALTMTAVIHDDLLVKNGDPVDIRITEEKEYKGQRIERSTFVTARAEVRGQRMALKVNRIPVGNSFIEVEMEAFDLDNLAGLRIPDNASKDIQGDVINDAISETGRRLNVPILGRTGQRTTRQVINDPAVKVDRGYKIILRQVK